MPELSDYAVINFPDIPLTPNDNLEIEAQFNTGGREKKTAILMISYKGFSNNSVLNTVFPKVIINGHEIGQLDANFDGTNLIGHEVLQTIHFDGNFIRDGNNTILLNIPNWLLPDTQGQEFKVKAAVVHFKQES